MHKLRSGLNPLHNGDSLRSRIVHIVGDDEFVSTPSITGIVFGERSSSVPERFFSRLNPLHNGDSLRRCAPINVSIVDIVSLNPLHNGDSLRSFGGNIFFFVYLWSQPPP